MAQRGLVRINHNENCGTLKERDMIKCEKMMDDSEKTDAVNVFFASLYSFFFLQGKEEMK